MKRASRSSFTSSGTGSGSALAAAPSTGEYLKQPTRSSRASRSQSSSSSKSASVSPGKPTMNVLRSVMSGQISRQRVDALERVLGVRRALHELEHARAAVLERDVEVRQHLAVGHQRNHVVDVRVRVHVVQAHPRAERSERTREVDELRLHRLAAPEARGVLEVGAVRARVLRDHQQFLHAGLHQALGLEHHLADRAAREVAAHRRDDAERAAVIAALGNLEVRIVPRREPDALRRHEVDERIVQRRQLLVHGLHDFLVRVRAR